MAEPVPQDGSYETAIGGKALQSLQDFSGDLKVEVLKVMASLAQNPIQPPATTGPIEDPGDMYIYQQADPHLQLTFRIDAQARRLVFVHLASSEFLKGKKRVVIARSRIQADKEWFEKVDKFLTQPLDEQAVFWDVTQVADGADREAEIQEQLDAADMVLMFVSQSYYNGEEVPAGLKLDTLIQKKKDEGLDIQWIPITASTWDDNPFLEGHTPLREIKKPYEYLENVPKNEQHTEILEINKKLKKLLED